MPALLERSPTPRRVVASCATLDSSRPALRIANAARSVPSAPSPVLTNVRAAAAVSRPIPPAPSVSTAHLVSTRPMTVSASNARSLRSRVVPALASAKFADLPRNRTPTRPRARSVPLVPSRTMMAFVRRVLPELRRRLVPHNASSASAVPRPIPPLRVACLADRVSSRTVAASASSAR